MSSISTARKSLVSEGETVPKWNVRPFQIVSLLEMLELYGYAFYATGALLHGVIRASDALVDEAEEQLAEEHLAVLKAKLEKMKGWCRAAGLTNSLKGVERVLKLPPEEFKIGALKNILGELQRRVEDELSSILFMHIPQDRADYYKNPHLFDEKVSKKLPKTLEDIQEAGKCFATARYTACVFHLMRVMERGVQRLGNKLKVPISVEERDWGAISSHINGALRRLPNSTPQERKLHTRYAKAAVYLDNVREAWRNPTMHPKETYTEEEAESVFRFVKQFMEHLAKIV